VLHGKEIGGLNIWDGVFVEFWVGRGHFSEWVWFFLRVETGGASFIAWRHAGRAFWKRSGESGAFLLGSLPIRQGRDLVGVCLYISATCGFAFLAYLMKRRWRRRSEERF
jgi:hypothetical protein